MREQRLTPRAGGLRPCWYRDPSGRYRSGAIVDLSARGARLVTEVRLELGAEFDLSLVLEPDWEMRARGRVAWIRAGADGTSLMGVALRLTGADRHLLAPWIRRKLNSGTAA